MEKMSNKYREFIRPFLDGELSREELDWFSKELESNAVLAEDIRLYREVDNAIREQDVMELRDQLDVIHNTIGEPGVPVKQTRYRKVISYGAIASLAILLSLGVLLKVQHKKLSNQQIYERHFEPYEVTMVYRSAGDEDLQWQKAVTAYNEQDYTAAIPLFKQLLEKHPEEMEYQLSLGISYMEEEQYNQAGSSFRTIIDQNDNLYIEQAEWYLGFCYLQTGQNEEARKQFREIARSNSSYNNKAKIVLRRIK